MKWVLGFLLLFAVPHELPATEPPLPAGFPAGAGEAVEKLVASLDRLAVLLEKDLASRVEDREARRVEVAVAVIGLRFRKIDRLDGEIAQIGREEEEFETQRKMWTEELEQLEKRGRAEDGRFSEETKGVTAQVALRIRIEEERIAKLRERKVVLQNDMAAEQRQLRNLEAILSAWMEKQ